MNEDQHSRVELSQNEMDDAINKVIAKKSGVHLHTSNEGFTQEQIYEFAGVNDYTANITLQSGSDSAKTFGNELTVIFVYTVKERNALRADRKALNAVANVKAKELLFAISPELRERLLKDGIPTRDIIDMLVLPVRDKCNTFESLELRKPKVLEVPFESEGKGIDIGWMYRAFCLYMAEGIALMPEEHAKYLAYKMIIEYDQLTKEERDEIFTEKGAVKNKQVAYYYLMWKKDAGLLSDKENRLLVDLSRNRFEERLALADKELRNMGLSLNKLAEKYPEKGLLLLKKINGFHEQRYNIVGKHLLYLSFESFLHIYFRHVKELSVANQFSERTKFQLLEKDLEATMNVVLHAFNEKYQELKEKNPDNRCFCKGSQAYYYNGDYYDIDVHPDGHIASFYKREK